jgi:hypothetical protein
MFTTTTKTTKILASGLSTPKSITLDNNGNIYFAEPGAIKKIARIGTDPTKADTDGDGLLDGYELQLTDQTGTPTTDTSKLAKYKTDPTNPDTDNDGLLDWGSIGAIKELLDPETLSIVNRWKQSGIMYKEYINGEGKERIDFYGESNYQTDPTKADTDGDGSWDGTEVKFQERGADPLVKQTTLVVTPTDSTKSPYYPFSGGTMPTGYESATEEKAGKDEPPWAPLAKELAPHLIYEKIGDQTAPHELPTSIFFPKTDSTGKDISTDMSKNGVPNKNPDGTDKTFKRLDITHDASTGVKFVGLTSSIGNARIIPYHSSLLGQICDWVDGGSSVSIGITNEYMGSYGSGTEIITYTDTETKTVILTKQGDTFTGSGTFTMYEMQGSKVTTTVHFTTTTTDLGSSMESLKGTGYYSHTGDSGWAWKKQNTAVYMHAITSIDPTTQHQLLGIQYWFYYPFHDDPGDPDAGKPNPHQHDWWYFWMVYDMTDKKPTTAYYDFHHNVRDLTWDQTPKEGFHPVVFVEAGGHRHLWGIGEHDTGSKDYGGGKIRARGINLDPIFDIMIAGLASFFTEKPQSIPNYVFWLQSTLSPGEIYVGDYPT